jgi:hypothetical protein
MDTTMPDRALSLSLWGIWWNAILLLCPAFSRLRTFMWFVTAVAGLTVRVDLLGVTSILKSDEFFVVFLRSCPSGDGRLPTAR